MYSLSGLLKILPTGSNSSHNKKSKAKSSRIVDLYQQDLSDGEISSILYGFQPVKNANFRKLKSRFVKHSTSEVLKNIEKIKLRNNYDHINFEVQKLLLVSQLLVLKDDRKSANPLLKKALQLAKNIELTPYILLLAKVLSRAAAFNGNKKVLQQYSALITQTTELLSIEVSVEQKYYTVISLLVNNSEYTTETIQEINSLYKYLKSIELNSYILKVYFFLVTVRYFQSQNNFNSVIKTCKSALAFLMKYPSMFQDVRAGEFSLYQMESCLRLLDFKQGRECAQQCRIYFKMYSTNWSIFYENYFLLLTRAKQFKQAIEVLNTIASSKYKFNKMNNSRIEKWKIYEAFLFFVNVDIHKNSFNLYKYLNEIKVFQHDKTGYFFTVWVSKILVLLKTNNYSKIYEIEDGFKTYLRRYINSQDHPRHHVFGHFILTLIKNSFNTPEMSRFSLILNKNTNFEETEIIPYEYLIESIIELLKNKSKFLYG